MRLVFTIIFLFVYLLNNSYSQQVELDDYNFRNKKVSILANSLALDRVFEQLSQQTGFYFTYDAGIIDGDKLITLQINNIALEDVLDTLLQTPNLNYERVYNQIVIYIDNYNYSQFEDSITYKYLNGRVIDLSTSKGLPFVSIAIKNCSFGGIANEIGDFSIKIPKVFFNDTLVFSYLGYYNNEIAINNFIDNQSVSLNQGVVSIQEVIVRSADPLLLLRKSRELITENYYKNPYGFQAFYREAVKKSSDYMFYSEALINGYKPSIISENSNNRVQLEKGRKFTNIEQNDTLLVKLRGGMEACFQLDIIHQLPDFLTVDGELLYNYSISDIIIWQDELAYVVDFKPRKSSLQSVFEGVIYLSVNSYAIIGADFSFSSNRIGKSGNSFVFRKSRKISVYPVSTQYQVQYAKWNGKYYTKHVRGELIIKIKKRRHIFHENYTTFMEMVYTQIDTTDVKRPSRSNIFHTNTIFSDSEYLYDYDFWDENNIISPENDIMDAFKRSGFKMQKTD